MGSRYDIFNKAMLDWVVQYLPNIKIDANSYRNRDSKEITWSIDYYAKGIRTNWTSKHPRQEQKQLFEKMEFRKGQVILTTMDGKRYGRGERAKKFEELKPKRKISDVAKLKSRYRRGVITYPAAIAKMKAAIEEQTLELPILQHEVNLVEQFITAGHHRFKNFYGIRLKPYPYHQSIISHATKMGGAAFKVMQQEFWQIRAASARLEDLHRRTRQIDRQVRSANAKILKKQQEMKKLTHGQDPKVKKSWEN